VGLQEGISTGIVATDILPSGGFFDDDFGVLSSHTGARVSGDMARRQMETRVRGGVTPNRGQELCSVKHWFAESREMVCAAGHRRPGSRPADFGEAMVVDLVALEQKSAFSAPGLAFQCCTCLWNVASPQRCPRGLGLMAMCSCLSFLRRVAAVECFTIIDRLPSCAKDFCGRKRT